MGGQGDLGQIGGQVGLGFILGVAVGYAAKKTLRITLLLTGALVVLGVALQQYGFISINWERLENIYNEKVLAVGGTEALIDTASSSLAQYLPFGGSFVLGFALGFRKG